mmetsp:Transcript_2648/g.5265  ORF Transcript_2648/g.5265 Transcript_2648/m.5265 type:complete len:88 (+) Transcript_2648:281-544(+)
MLRVEGAIAASLPVRRAHDSEVLLLMCKTETDFDSLSFALGAHTLFFALGVKATTRGLTRKSLIIGFWKPPSRKSDGASSTRHSICS